VTQQCVAFLQRTVAAMPQISEKSVDKTGYWRARLPNFSNTGLHLLSGVYVIDENS
jgi:hypothetical protein